VHGLGESRTTLLSLAAADRDRLAPPADLADQVAAALREDIGSGDVTAALVPVNEMLRAKVATRETMILSGRPWVEETFRQLDPTIELTWHAREGDRLPAGAPVFTVSGLARPILTGERTAINFLQVLSATATSTRRFVDAVAGTGCIILDTRKTLPGLRHAQKYAVRCGGAQNHRMGLYDQVLIKENHIAAAGSLEAALAAARAHAPGLRVEVEVETMLELEAALGAPPDIILLDDFSVPDIRAAAALRKARAPSVALEASGGVSIENVRAVAETGVDYISIGSITKNVRAIDLSMRAE